MPHLLIRGIAPERVQSVARPLVEELASICECPADYMLLECLQTTAAGYGEPAESYPFVEVAWFDRGLETQDRFARAVDRYLRRELGLAELEIAFRAYRERDYYANGVTLGEETGTQPPAEEELEALRLANRKLAEELKKARKALASASGSGMSTKLRDALRE